MIWFLIFRLEALTALELVLCGCRRMLCSVVLNSEHVLLNIAFLFFQVSEATFQPFITYIVR
jgi:hypothetical protein